MVNDSNMTIMVNKNNGYCLTLSDIKIGGDEADGKGSGTKVTFTGGQLDTSLTFPVTIRANF